MSCERWLVLAGLLLGLVSLTLPALVGQSFPSQRGLDLLRQGAGLWRDGVYAWFANPLLLLALILGWFGRYRLALGAGAAGLLLALSTLTAAGTLEAAGRSVPEFRFGLGFYVWLGAFACALTAAGLGLAGAARRDAA